MKNRRITNLGMTAIAVLASCVVSTTQAAEILVDSSILDRAMDVIGSTNSSLASTTHSMSTSALTASPSRAQPSKIPMSR